MRFARKIDPKIAQSIQADIAEIDKEKSMPNKSTPQLETDTTPAKELQTCDCTGGPGKNNQPGTGLIDDFTVCPKCNGTGKV